MVNSLKATLRKMGCFFCNLPGYCGILIGLVKNKGAVKVVAAILEKDGRILIARRRKGDRLGGKWEFPGGKIAEGETPETGLERELKEELDIETKTGQFVVKSRFEYMCVPLEILAYRSQYLSGDIKLKEHDEIAWVLPGDLGSYDFVGGDIPIVEKIIKEFKTANIG